MVNKDVYQSDKDENAIEIENIFIHVVNLTRRREVIAAYFYMSSA